MIDIALHNELKKIALIKGIYKKNWYNDRLGRTGKIYGKQAKELENVRWKVVSRELSSKILTTEKVHCINGQWSQQRQKIHNQIISEYTSKLITQEKPKVILLAGGGGSGKGFISDEYLKKDTEGQNFAYLNSDEVKEKLPEYGLLIKSAMNIAADRVHEESSHIAGKVLEQITSKRSNFIFDTALSNPEKSKSLIQQLVDKGYEVELHFVDTNLRVAKASAMRRAEKTGRLVNSNILEQANKGARDTFELLKDSELLSRVVKYNNSGQLEKKTPKVEIVK